MDIITYPLVTLNTTAQDIRDFICDTAQELVAQGYLPSEADDKAEGTKVCVEFDGDKTLTMSAWQALSMLAE